MHVGPHDVYPTIDVNFSILTRECKYKKFVDNIFSSIFSLLLLYHASLSAIMVK